jgi:hypothetical protein
MSSLKITRVWKGNPTTSCDLSHKASIHHVVERKIEDIHVVREFPDDFPNDLPGMPPERAIKFKIELQPGTAPISKALYRMMLVELVELKIQLQDLRQRFYLPKFITLGLSSIVRIEEG